MWRRRDSNPGPSACKADALNQLSYASIFTRLGTAKVIEFFIKKTIFKIISRAKTNK